MAFENVLVGGSSGTKADVNSNNELKVALGLTPAGMGGVRMFCENDPGTVVGTPYLKSPEVSQDYRMRVGVDTVLFTDTFNSITQNTSLYSYAFSTLTVSTSTNSGMATFGAVQGTAVSHGAYLRSWRTFPLIGTAPLAVEFTAGQFTSPLIANEVWAMGLGLPGAAGTAPTDGVWLQLTSAGLIGVMAYNGNLTQSGVLLPLSSITLGELHKFTIVIGENEVEYWKDDVLIGEQIIPVANGQPFLTTSLPIFMQKYNTGSVTNTNTMRVSDVTVTLMDLNTNKGWAEQMCGMGLSGYQGQNGGTMGSACFTGTITTGSSAVATAATLSNTAAGFTGLGGQFQYNQVAAAATDLIVMAFSNSSITPAVTPRTLYIKGVKISCMNNGAAAPATPSVVSWWMGYGSTTLTLATTESASFATGTAKAARRIPLGMMGLVASAAVGQMYDRDIQITFTSPVVVNPGEVVQFFIKQMVGTANASQTVYGHITVDSYWE